MSDVQDANARFDQLWEQIGAKRIIIGDADKSVEIVVDADLSIFNILEKLKEAARDPGKAKDLDADECKALANALEECSKVLETRVPRGLRGHLDKLIDR